MMLLIQVSYHSGCFFWKSVDKSETSLGLKYAGTQEKWLWLPQVQSITNVYRTLNLFLSQAVPMKVNYIDQGTKWLLSSWSSGLVGKGKLYACTNEDGIISVISAVKQSAGCSGNIWWGTKSHLRKWHLDWHLKDKLTRLRLGEIAFQLGRVAWAKALRSGKGLAYIRILRES